MGAEAVGAQLEKEGSAAFAHGRRRAPAGVLDRAHVHAVDGPGRHLVARRLQAQVGLRLGARQRRAHRVQVVLAAEQHGQLPECRQVHALVELAFGDGAFAEEACRHAPASLELVRERETHGEREAAAHDRVAPEEAAAGVEDVHRAAAAAAAALELAVHLGEEAPGGDAASEGVAVLPIGGDDRIVRLERLEGAHGDGLLADVQMQEAADLPRAVELRTLLLEAPDAQHLAQQLHVVREGRGCGRARAHASPSEHRGVALGQAELARLEQPAQDLAAARLRYLREELHLLGRDGGAEARAPEALDLPQQRLALDAAGPQRDERLHDLAGHGVRHPDHRRLGDRRVLHQRALHLEGADQVSGRLDHVVRASHEPVVAVCVAAHEIARQVPACQEALAVALGLAEVGAKHRGPAGPQRELSLHARLADLQERAVAPALDDSRLDTRERQAHRARADLERREVGDHDPAGLRLPPVVVDRETERLVSPDYGLGIERLADARDEAQRGKIEAARERRPRLHQHAQRRRRRVPDRDALALERSIPALRVEFGLVHDARHGVRERRHDAVRGARHPAGVRRTPEDVVRVQVECERARDVVGDDGAVHVQGAFGRPRGSAREVQQRRILRVRVRDLKALVRGGEHRVEPLRARRRPGRGVGVADEPDVLERGQSGAQAGDLAPVEGVARHEHAALSEREPLADRIRPEGGEEGAEHEARLERAERGDVELESAAAEREDPLALLQSERGERAREAVAERGKLGVAHVARHPGLRAGNAARCDGRGESGNDGPRPRGRCSARVRPGVPGALAPPSPTRTRAARARNPRDSATPARRRPREAASRSASRPNHSPCAGRAGARAVAAQEACRSCMRAPKLASAASAWRHAPSAWAGGPIPATRCAANRSLVRARRARRAPGRASLARALWYDLRAVGVAGRSDRAVARRHHALRTRRVGSHSRRCVRLLDRAGRAGARRRRCGIGSGAGRRSCR